MQRTLFRRAAHTALFLAFTLCLQSQTQLYAPNGGAVGTSTTANVGIGTNSPGLTLDVNGPIRSFAGAIDVRLQAGAAGAAGIGSFSNDPLLFISAGAERMRLTTTGRLGIGTQSPGAMLHTHGPSDGMNFFFTTAGATASWNGGAYSDNSFRINQAGVAARFIINSAGNVGVGTTSPASGLAIASEGANYADGSYLLVNSSNSTFGGGATLVGIKTAASDGGDYNFLKLQNAGGIKFVINGAGNVGIGTTNPTQKLSVKGTVRAQEVIVDTGWSDFVFDESYKLKALSETEAFVKTEKHLPGIPSAKEVAENGISIGDMQAKLLAKIEELTLHVIEQQKQIEAMKRENGALRQRFDREFGPESTDKQSGI